MKHFHDHRVCANCSDVFEIKRGAKQQNICPECRNAENWRKTPPIESIGNCVCWFDGHDREIAECNIRREVANKRAQEGKPYQMPQCFRCLKRPEFTPKEQDRRFFCTYCGKEYEPALPQQRHCSRKCAVKYTNQLRYRREKLEREKKRNERNERNERNDKKSAK